MPSHGVDEVVFLNENNELTEGSITTLFIERDGMLLTPPLSAGLLPGTLRAELLDTGRAREQGLTLADLDGAEQSGSAIPSAASSAAAGSRPATGAEPS